MNSLIRLYFGFDAWLGKFTPLIDLAIRLYISWIFFRSGLLKIQSWESTKSLFEYEYAVPLLSPQLAAVLGTAAELILPVLLALGLVGRMSALALLVFNVIAVISYPDLSDGGLQFHILWGLLLAVLMTHGPGCLSIDSLIRNLAKRRGTI